MTEAPADVPSEAAPPAPPHALLLAERAFTLGDYAAVRRLTQPLLSSPDPSTAARAKDLRARTSIDPGQVVAVLACLAFFAVIAYVYLHR